MLLLLLGVVSFEVASGSSGGDATFSTAFTAESTRLRANLMAGYDKHVPPTSDRSAAGVTYSAAGTDIAIQVRFFKVETVRASHGDMKLKICMRGSETQTLLFARSLLKALRSRCCVRQGSATIGVATRDSHDPLHPVPHCPPTA